MPDCYGLFVFKRVAVEWLWEIRRPSNQTHIYWCYQWFLVCKWLKRQGFNSRTTVNDVKLGRHLDISFTDPLASYYINKELSTIVIYFRVLQPSDSCGHSQNRYWLVTVYTHGDLICRSIIGRSGRRHHDPIHNSVILFWCWTTKSFPNPSNAERQNG